MNAIALDSISRASLLLDSRLEFLRLLRTPSFAVPALVFPVMFYLLFGVLLAGGKQLATANLSHYLMATYCVFGVIAPGLFGFGVGVASERERGLLQLKRALPMPTYNYVLAKLAMALLFAAVIVVMVGTTAVVFGGVRLAPTQWLLLSVVAVLGALPFCALGLGLGYLVGPNSAPPIVNLIYLPMSFLSGLWLPFEILPPTVKAIAPFLPAYHFAQLALGAVGAGAGAPAWTHVTALIGFSIVGLALAVWGYRRDEDRMWG